MDDETVPPRGEGPTEQRERRGGARMGPHVQVVPPRTLGINGNPPRPFRISFARKGSPNGVLMVVFILLNYNDNSAI